jgi:hypothetical protein
MLSAYFPVGITPTKPLTPTHVRGLLHLDGLVRLHKRVSPVRIAHNRRLWDLSQQTLQFWDWLDRHHAGTDFQSLSDDQVGHLYVQCAKSGHKVPAADMRALWHRTHDEGYVHPASQALLRTWLPQLDHIGVDASALLLAHQPAATEGELMDTLASQDLLIDQRDVGGGVYVDLTLQGSGLRQLISEDGVPNYLHGLLREAIDLARQRVDVILFSDSSVERDFLLIERVMQGLGRKVARVNFPRVLVNGQPLSYRQDGGFYTLSSMLERDAGRHTQREMRLALRLLFLQMHGIKRAFDFSWDAFDRACALARKTITQLGDTRPMDDDAAAALWQSLVCNDSTMNLLAALTRLASPREDIAVRATLMHCLVDAPHA